MAAANDLKLICSNGDEAYAASSQLIDASCNSAFKEIIAKAMSERQGSGLAQLRVPDDSAVAWRQCIGLLQAPTNNNFRWESIAPVLRLCHKYELKPVLETCQERITFTAFPANSSSSPSVQARRLYMSLGSYYNPLGMTSHVRNLGLDNGPEAVGKYVEIATLLYDAGLRYAYNAFIHLWISRFYQAIKSQADRDKIQSEVQHWVSSLTNQLHWYFDKEPPSPARYQLAVDLLAMLPKLSYNG